MRVTQVFAVVLVWRLSSADGLTALCVGLWGRKVTKTTTKMLNSQSSGAVRKVEVVVLGSPPRIVRTVSVDVKLH